ncbi:MAG: hypothetical protein WCW36_03695 [Candidatus Paceibacterota bacterium]
MEQNIKPEPATWLGKTPEKYIRTFASDMDISKKGGTPGLVPLRVQQPAPSVPGALTQTLISQAPIPEDFSATASKPKPAIMASTQDTMSEQVVAPKPQTPVAIPEPTIPAPLSFKEQIPLETYSEDFRKRMEETHASTATVLAAEQDSNKRFFTATSENPVRNGSRWYLVVAGIVLVVVGGAGAYLAYTRYLVAHMPITIPGIVQTPIFVDSREDVSGTGAVLLQAIEQSAVDPLEPSTIRALLLEASTTDMNVLSALGVPAPGIFLRNIRSAGSMAGIVNAGGEQSPFFILSVGSYSATFSGLLSWEPTMQSDLAKLFPLYPAIVEASSTVATTTPALSEGSFRDETVSNHDVRVYRDLLGRSILLYGYWNQSTLVIARDPVAFIEILRRLATSHN